MDFRTWVKNNGDASYLAFLGNDGKIDPNKSSYTTRLGTYDGSTPNIYKLQGQANQWYDAYNSQPVAQTGSTYTGKILGTESYGAYGGGGSTGGGVAVASGPSAADIAASNAYYDDQERNAQSALGRLSGQRDVGNSNIDNSYQSSYNKLLGQNAQAERDYNLQSGRAVEDNRVARSSIDSNVSRQATGLRRLLGGDSSAGKYLAPFLVAQQGTKQMQDVQRGYGRNMQNLDIANSDRARAFEGNKGDLAAQKEQKRRELESGLKQTEVGLNEQFSNIRLQRAQAQGRTYDQVRNDLNPYTSRVQQLLGEIDNLGRQYSNPVMNVGDIKYAAPDLAQYNPQGVQIAPGQSAIQDLMGTYFPLLNEKEREKQLLA